MKNLLRWTLWRHKSYFCSEWFLAKDWCLASALCLPIVCTDYTELYLTPAKHLFSCTHVMHKSTQGRNIQLCTLLQPTPIKKSRKFGKSSDMIRFVVQLALTLAGAYLSFYVANGPCEFSGNPSFMHCLVPFIFSLLPLCSDLAYRLICAS